MVSRAKTLPPAEPFQAIGLPPPKPKRKPCTLYLEEEMMDRVRRLAKQRGVPIGAVIEACVKLSLEQMEERS